LRGADDGYSYLLKGGQGVSAQPKTLNHLVGAWVTAVERRCRKDLKDNIHLGYGYSKSKFRKIYRVLARNNRQGDAIYWCDITEQDTSKGPWTNHYMRRVYNYYGCPDKIVDLIECANINWRIEAPDAKLNVSDKFQSGRADTLFSNSMMDLGLILSCMEYEEMRMAWFQGDDSYLRARQMQVVIEHKSLKVASGGVGDFVGFVMGERDVYLDIPRFVVKLMNKSFKSDEQIAEYRMAVFDWMSIYQDPQQLHEGIVLNAFRYGISFEKMALLFSLLRSFYTGKLVERLRERANPNFANTTIHQLDIGLSRKI
jgi:hypothetical protein